MPSSLGTIAVSIVSNKFNTIQCNTVDCQHNIMQNRATFPFNKSRHIRSLLIVRFKLRMKHSSFPNFELMPCSFFVFNFYLKLKFKAYRPICRTVQEYILIYPLKVLMLLFDTQLILLTNFGQSRNKTHLNTSRSIVALFLLGKIVQ